MEQEKQPIGLLFDSMAYYSPEDISILTDNLTYEQSYYVLTQALEFAYRANLFSLQESELVSKSLRILNSPKTEE
jgi:hypothetical protein